MAEQISKRNAETNIETKRALPRGKALFYGVTGRARLILEILGEVGDQPAAVALEVEDLVQRRCQRPLAATAWAGARLLLGRAHAAHPVEVVVGGDAGQHLQPFGEIAATPVETTAHFANLVQRRMFGDGAVHLQLIARLPILLQNHPYSYKLSNISIPALVLASG